MGLLSKNNKKLLLLLIKKIINKKRRRRVAGFPNYSVKEERGKQSTPALFLRSC
jgi:hypothetical protein